MGLCITLIDDRMLPFSGEYLTRISSIYEEEKFLLLFYLLCQIGYYSALCFWYYACVFYVLDICMKQAYNCYCYTFDNTSKHFNNTELAILHLVLF